ncbi:MAG: MFS transporter [SAR324 cluster bacterium]|nr:MFS transporter [SAR324 cluster bacterium]
MNQNIFLRIRIFLASIIILLLAQAFSASLSISSFEKLYRNSLISSYQVFARDFQRNVSSAIRFGKPLEKFVGIKALMEEIQRNNPELENVIVTSTDGTILYSLDPKLNGTEITGKLKIDFGQQSEKSGESQYILVDNSYHIPLPIKDRRKKWVGSIDLSFKKEIIQNKVTSIIVWTLQIFGISTMIAGGLLIFCLNSFVSFKTGAGVPKARIYYILLLILGVTQISYSIFNVQYFRNNYIEITRIKSEKLTQLLKDDIEFLLGKGIKINRLIKVDNLMSEIIQVTPEIEDMRIVDKDDQLLYIANKKGVVKVNKGSDQKDDKQTIEAERTDSEDNGKNGWDLIGLENDNYEVAFDLLNKDDVEGKIKVQLSREVIGNKIQENILDAITVVVISLLFVVELVIVFLIFIARQMDAEKEEGEDTATAYGLIRPVAFILLFAVALTVSFLPLHMANIYEPIFGLSKDVVTGLPISIEMLFTLIVLFPCASWMDKKGWHGPFLLGSAITGVALFLSGIASGPLEFLVYRGILGVGYGLAWLSVQGFVLSNTDTSNRARGFSTLVAGIFSGSICGGAAGGMLAERIGYVPVFFVAGGLMVLPILFTIIFLRKSFITPEANVQQEKLESKSFFQFFFNRNIFSTFIFSIVPTSICLVGILYFMSPIYLNQIGVSQSNIGRAFMVFGLCMIFIAPFISRFVDRSESKKKFIVISGLCGGLGLSIFFFHDGFSAVVMMILMLGLASSFGSASQMVYVLNLKITHEVGLGKVVSAQRTSDKLGQMLGPIILGVMISVTGVEQGIAIVGLVYLIFTVLFLVGAQREKVLSLPR